MLNHLSKYDQFVRLITGGAIIAVVLMMPHAPAWLALLATYPVFTAIIRWDPFYQAILSLAGRPRKAAIPAQGQFKASM